MDDAISNRFDYFTDDFLRESIPRTVVIVAASKIDDLLACILSTYFLPKASKVNDNDELLEGDKPLATFSARIKMIYRLGIVDKSFYLILEKIRSIRNLSAHELNFDIAISPLKELLFNLMQEIKNRNSYKLTKERYFGNHELNGIDELKSTLLAICILLEAINVKVERTSISQSLVDISLK